MKLSEKEAIVLSCVEFRADLSIEQIAKETKLQTHTVRYHLKSLEERSLIRKVPIVDLVAAGYSYYGIFFSTRSKRSQTTKDLLASLIGMRDVVWLAEMGGDFHYGLAWCASTLQQIGDRLDELNEKFPTLFYEKSVACQFSFTAFPRRFLSAKKFPHGPISIGNADKHIILDETDKIILRGLTSLPYRSRRELAQRLKIPLSTLDLRIRKLEQRKIILGYVYEIATHELGLERHTLLIYCNGMSRKLSQGLYDFAERCEWVTHLFSCFGSWDFELNVEVSEARVVRKIVEDIYDQFGAQVHTIKTLANYRTLKFSLVPF